ncbi:MAG TPA: hypothetical protein ENI87_04685 [bacterium]|nr:hypothetical protein [bacterium]
MSPSSATAGAAEAACLHCSPARTVWRRRTADGEVVEKVYESGSLADAEREAALGMLATGPSVVEYLGAGTDAATGRPKVTLRYVAGENLEARVARLGALPAAAAIELLLPVARALARLHALRRDGLPHGLCHGDVKPQNLLATDGDTLLLDFEHATAIGGADERPFTGGTSAWSPPEALLGAPPHKGFDVFGFGATLAFLLDGGVERRLPRHPDVDALVATCCAPEPDARPTADEIAVRCERLLAVLRDDPLERNLHDWATGDLATVPTAPRDPRATVWFRRRRLLQRLPKLLAPTAPPARDPDLLRADLDAVDRVLARFPRNPAALQRRVQLLRAIGERTASAAEVVRERERAEAFDDALHWLRKVEALATTALHTPGGLAAVTAVAPGAQPGPLQRDPIGFLRRLSEQTETVRGELQARVADITAAEQALDLETAELRLEALAADLGGTSPTVAERRDLLHRLEFYLDRIARAQANVERVAPLWDPDALRPLQAIVAAADAALQNRPRRDGGGNVGLRSLQLTLRNVAEEFPHLQQVEPALSSLSRVLEHLTEQAWQQLSDAEQRLRLVPVPVRPLQLALGRLDTLRTLEAFIDRPERARSELLDGIERLRLGLEQARSARDRLAENAEHALARGHWTTGLFEMERAVARLNPADDDEQAEAKRLRERLQAARRTKQEIEAAVRRNSELASEYTKLEDDPASTFGARLQLLQERRDCLMFLVMHVQSERAELYCRDLRSVEAAIAVERAGDAERRLDALAEPGQRLRLARETLETLGAGGSSGGTDDGEAPGRLVRLREHWRTVAAQCQRAIEAQHREQDRRRRQSRRMLALALLAVAITGTAVAFAIQPQWLGSVLGLAPVMAKER